MTRAFLLPALLIALAGCSRYQYVAEEFEPAGLVITPGETFQVRAEGTPEDHIYVAQLENRVGELLVWDGFEHRPDGEPELSIFISVRWLEKGDERGTQAECAVTVTLIRDDVSWRLDATGYSGSRWQDDRIPTAVNAAAQAVVDRVLSARAD